MKDCGGLFPYRFRELTFCDRVVQTVQYAPFHDEMGHELWFEPPPPPLTEPFQDDNDTMMLWSSLFYCTTKNYNARAPS